MGTQAFRVGFSGTARGLTEPQRDALTEEVQRHYVTEAHHGDSLGADAEFHGMVELLRPHALLVIHPGTDSLVRAFCAGGKIHTPKYREQRNGDIVRASQIVLAAPGGMKEEEWVDVWLTIRLARAEELPVSIVWPDGSITREREDKLCLEKKP